MESNPKRRRALVAASVTGALVIGSAGGVLASHQFSDVPDTNPFHDDIDWMADAGITGGFGDGTFRPTDAVSRQAMAAFMRRFDDTDKQVSAGTGHTCGVAFDAAWCWGNNSGDHLGDGGVVTGAPEPQRTVGLSSGVTAVTSSISHSCAVADGDVYCWGGNNNNGQLGHEDDDLVGVPTLVAGLSGTATDVAVGLQHTCAIVDGAAWCWGRAGRLGIGENTQSTTPQQVVGLTSGVTAISAGEDHSGLSSHRIAPSPLRGEGWGEGFSASNDHGVLNSV